MRLEKQRQMVKLERKNNMTIVEAKEKQRLEMQSALSVIRAIIEDPPEQTGYRTPEIKLQGILARILKLNKDMDRLFDSATE